VKLSELEVSTWMLRAFAAAWGCIWGSFVNVVVYRVPREMSVVRPASHCPGCGAPVKAVDNIPIVSFLVLRGRARCCKARISPRYVVVELLGGLLAVAVYEVVVRGLSADAPLPLVASVFLSDFGLAIALVAAAFIDAEHMYLPDAITIGGTVFGLATPGLRGMGYIDALVGAAVGFIGVWLPLVVGYETLRGRPGMGLGDAKLVMLAGAWFGWRGAAFTLFAGAVQASVAAIAILVLHGKIEEPESVRRDREELRAAAAAGDEEARQAVADDPLATAPAQGVMAARMPFGPFLCLAAIEWLFAGRAIEQQYF
jgi:leader peptidase (prepilin peptidase) / N-methyltransferase